MPYALLGLLIVLVLVEAFLLWKARADWRWFEMLAVFVTITLAVVFVFPVAGALKSRSAWHKIKEDLEVRLETAVGLHKDLRDGDRNNPLSDQGVLPLTQKLAALGIEAGRRWRGLRLTNSDFNGEPSIVLSRPVDDAVDAGAVEEPAAGAAAEPAPQPLPLMDTGMIVYGFGEGRGPNIDVPVPVAYLGEFRVVSSTPNQVTLTTTQPLMPDQQALIASGEARSWSIYEMLPLDGHEPFVAEGSAADDDNVLGRIDDQLVNAVLSQASEETRAKYLRDGSRVQPDDPPLTRWVKVEFLKPYSIGVDSPDKRPALDGGFFDGDGRAVDSRLQVGGTGDVKFEKGQQLLVKEEAADALKAEGFARLVDEYYLRPLNNYRLVLRQIRLRNEVLKNRTVQLTREQKILQASIDVTVSMLAANQTEKLLLEQDFDQTEVERKAIQEHHEALAKQIKATREKLVGLYRSNQALEAELTEFHRSIESNVNSLTAAGR